ncbi:MAG TPA: YheU family protein [Candidatus Tenderia sp.]|nr:YheU family protein [Candidatus Tenderia sp.]
MIIPPHELSPEALQGIIEEFITREGTDYGEGEFTLADKVAQVRRQLERKEAFIVFDVITERCNILAQEQLLRYEED